MGLTSRKVCRVLFDETHSETWTIDFELAKEVQPDNPRNSSYSTAAKLLGSGDFEFLRFREGRLSAEILSDIDILVVVHPSEAKWEDVIPGGAPVFRSDEIDAVRRYVFDGGVLIVISEYENDKYGNNLNELLAPYSMVITNETVTSRSDCVHGIPTWVVVDVGRVRSPILEGSESVCFYRAGSVQAEEPLDLVLRLDNQPPGEALVVCKRIGDGKVAVVCDSDIFGDEYISEFHNLALLEGIFYWCAERAFSHYETARPAAPEEYQDIWLAIRRSVNQLRALQSADGSVAGDLLVEADRHVTELLSLVAQLVGVSRPEEAEYLRAVLSDLSAWAQGGFCSPDFLPSLKSFHPERYREEGRLFRSVFPQYTPNASADVRFEAVQFTSRWPDWLAWLERERFPNKSFVSGALIDFTEGYDSECAVLFPETVSVGEQEAPNEFGVIFADREAARLQRYARAAIDVLDVNLPVRASRFLDCLALIEDSYSLWDLIHDRTHSMGALPFDPFMIKQPAPYWMGGVEELRVDLVSYGEARKLEVEGFRFAAYVKLAIVFDRIFRFPISGSRIRNYDALAGQLLFAFLHRNGVVRWYDNRLSINWGVLDNGVNDLRSRIDEVYAKGVDQSRLGFWISCFGMVAEYVEPTVDSSWRRGVGSAQEVEWLTAVRDDEFPLSNFYRALHGKLRLRGVIV